MLYPTTFLERLRKTTKYLVKLQYASLSRYYNGGCLGWNILTAIRMDMTHFSRELCVRLHNNSEDLVFVYSCLCSWFSGHRTSRKGRKITWSVQYVILYFSVDWVLPDNGSNSVWGMNVSCRFLLYTRVVSHTITLELHEPPFLILRMRSALVNSLWVSVQRKYETINLRK